MSGPKMLRSEHYEEAEHLLTEAAKAAQSVAGVPGTKAMFDAVMHQADTLTAMAHVHALLASVDRLVAP